MNLVVLGILGFKTLACLAHPEWLFGPGPLGGADALHAYSMSVAELAGRNLSMALVSLLALWRSSPAWYRAVFAMGLVRETWDAGLVLWSSGQDVIGQAAVFLPFLGVYALALVALARRGATQREAEHG